MRQKDKNYRRTEAVLYKYCYIKTQIEQDKKILKELEDLPPGLAAYDYTKIRVQNNNIVDSTFKEALKSINDKKRIQKQIKSNEAIINKVDLAMNYLSDEERKLIVNKYFKRMTSYEVYMKLDMSPATYFRLKKSVINKIALVLFGKK